MADFDSDFLMVTADVMYRSPQSPHQIFSSLSEEIEENYSPQQSNIEIQGPGLQNNSAKHTTDCKNGFILLLHEFEELLPPHDQSTFKNWREKNKDLGFLSICYHPDPDGFAYVYSTGSYNLKKFPSFCTIHQQYFTLASNMVGNHMSLHQNSIVQSSEENLESPNRKVKSPKVSLSKLSSQFENLTFQVTDIEDEQIVMKHDIAQLKEKEEPQERARKVARKGKQETFNRILMELNATTNVSPNDIQISRTIITKLYETDFPAFTGKVIGNMCAIPHSDANRVLFTIMLRRKWIAEDWGNGNIHKYIFPSS